MKIQIFLSFALSFTLSASVLRAQMPTNLESLVRAADVFLDPLLMEPFNGPVVRYWDTGRERVVADLTDGRTQGEVRMYHSNGNLAYEGNHFMGQPDGLEKTYYENGNLFEERFYNAGIYDGPFRKYYVNENLNYS